MRTPAGDIEYLCDKYKYEKIELHNPLACVPEEHEKSTQFIVDLNIQHHQRQRDIRAQREGRREGESDKKRLPRWSRLPSEVLMRRHYFEQAKGGEWGGGLGRKP